MKKLLLTEDDKLNILHQHKKQILMEEIISNMKFEMDIILDFTLDKQRGNYVTAPGGREIELTSHVDKRMSERSISYSELEKLFNLFKEQIAEQIFLGNIKDIIEFAIDSKNAGIGFVLYPRMAKDKINNWTFTIKTVYRHKSKDDFMLVRKGQLLLKDGGKSEFFSKGNVIDVTPKKINPEPNKPESKPTTEPSRPIRFSNQQLFKKL